MAHGTLRALGSAFVFAHVLFLSAPAALCQVIRLGSEFQVNTYTPSHQAARGVAVAADGDFVIAWQGSEQDGSGNAVLVRLFSSAGASLAAEFQLSIYTPNTQSYPSVAALAGGDFVVAWQSRYQDGSDYGVFARRFSGAGAALAAEFQVNTYTQSEQRHPVAAAVAGGFVVAWESYGPDGSNFGIFARRFSSDATALATEFQINTYTTNSQNYPGVAASAQGDFVVVWESAGQDGANSGVFARRFTSAGTALAAELQVNTHTPSFQKYPRVAADADGDFVVAWESDAQDGSQSGSFARRFSSAGTALATEFQVNTYTTGFQRSSGVAAAANGDFLVAWESDLQDGSSFGIFARYFSSAGPSLTAEFQVNTYTTNFQRYPFVAANADGRFVVAWQSYGQDGDTNGVFAQRLTAPAVLDIDGNGAVTALTDGLLVLRYLFGFTGPTLTGGAVGAGCTRCNAAVIEPYLQGLV